MEFDDRDRQPWWKVAVRTLTVALGLLLTLLLSYFVVLFSAAEVSGSALTSAYWLAKYLGVAAALSSLVASVILAVSFPSAGMPHLLGYLPVVLFALLATYGLLSGGGLAFGLIFAVLSVLAWWLNQ